MKTINVLILLVILTSFGLSAQKPIVISEDSISFRSGKIPGLVVTIPEAVYESVKKNWEKEMESGTKSKAVYENGEWSIFGANLKKIFPTPVNVYSKLVDQDSLVKFMAAIELKKDVYVEKGSAEAELAQMKTYMKEFAKNQYTAVAEKQLEAEEKKLKDLEKALESYQKDEADLEKSINSDEQTIQEQENNLVVLNNELTALSAEIITQNSQLTSLTEGAAREQKEKYIKDLDKREKKLRNDIKSAENKISKSKDDIRDANNEIPKKQQLQKEMHEKVAAQEAVVRKYEDKLNKIKAY
jgi:DNA repair exonuclease SbcCD ATPase subunit